MTNHAKREEGHSKKMALRGKEVPIFEGQKDS
jgi:hypothetical protein